MAQLKNRLLFLSPTVLMGLEKESTIKDFDVIKPLGSGAFGKVHHVIHKGTKKEFAMKQIERNLIKSSGMAPQLANEVKIMYALYHQNIVQLYNHFEDENYVYLLMEFCKGGQLYHKLMKQQNKRFDEKTVILIIRDLVNALDYVHNKGVIHRDIKPENILIDEKGCCKLADFGWSNFEQPKQKRDTYCGTLDYLAPEMVDPSHRHNKSVDIWSVGVLIFELLTGRAPFSPLNDNLDPSLIEEQTKKNIADVKINYPKDFPPLAKILVNKILVKDIEKRANLQQIKDDQWLKPSSTSSPVVKTTSEMVSNLNEFRDMLDKHLKKNKELEEHIKGLNKTQGGFSYEEVIQITRPDSILNGDFVQKGQKKIEDEKEDIYPKKEQTQLKKEYEHVYGELKSKNTEVVNLKKELETTDKLKELFIASVKEKHQLYIKLNQAEDDRKSLKQQFDKIEKEKTELQLKFDNLTRQSSILSQSTSAGDITKILNSNLQFMEAQCKSMEKQVAEVKGNAEGFSQNQEYIKKVESENQQLRLKIIDLQLKIKQ